MTMTTIERILGTRDFTGWHMLGVLFLFFGTIIGVNLVLAWFAATSWTGLVVKNSYVASQQFNETTAERLKGASLGWTARADYAGGIFSVEMVSADGTPVRLDAIKATIGHPATNRDDRTVELVASGDGRYEGTTELAAGLWQADFEAVAPDGTRWLHSIRFTVAENAL
jgi:nitrogen fixation protein FixH